MAIEQDKESDRLSTLAAMQHHRKEISRYIVVNQMWPNGLGSRLEIWGPFLESSENFSGPKTIRKTATCLFCKAGLFICCRGDKNKNDCKVSCLKTPSF